MKNSNVCVVLSVAAGLVVAAPARGVEVLVNGGFEDVETVIAGWELDGFRTADPSIKVNAGELVDFANDDSGDPGFGLWLRAFVGNPVDGLADTTITQVVPGVAGETYTLSARGRFEGNYAGGVATLDPGSPFGAIPSPTRTEIELAFLNGSGAVIGSPIVGNVAADVFNGLGWDDVTPISGVAPVGTASVRVRGLGREMAFNIDPQQSGFLDTFSLTAASSPSTQLLDNGDFVTGAEEILAGWEFIEPTGDTLSLAGFANNTPGGSNGVWIRAFATGDSTVTQTLPAVVGGEYTLAVSSRWEANYSGGQVGSGTETLLELAFLDGTGAVVDSTTLDLRTVQMNDNTWRTHTLSGVAPAGAASVRVSGLTTGMVNTTGAQSAFWDDFSLMLEAAGLPGDANGDGSVDLLDLDILGANFGLTGGATNGQGDFNGDGNVDLLDLDILGANFGSGGAAAAGVPEPAGALLALAGLAGLARRRR